MILRLGLLAPALALLLVPAAWAAQPLAGTVTLAGSQPGYVLVDWPGGDADWTFTQWGEFAGSALVRDGVASSWDHAAGATVGGTCGSCGIWAGGGDLPAGSYRLYLLTPPGTTASVTLDVPGLNGTTTLTPDTPAPLHQKVRTGRPSVAAPATLVVGGSEIPSSGSIGFHSLKFEADGPGTGEVCNYAGGDFFNEEVPDDSGPLAYEPGCADGLWTLAHHGRGIVGDVPATLGALRYSTQSTGWFAPDDSFFYSFGGNLTSAHNPRLTMTSTWIDFAD